MGAVLEREDELAATGELVDRVLRGGGGLLLVEGDAGIGKTTLVGAAREVADGRGVAVAGARGAELERELAFGVVHELLAPVVVPAAGDAAAAVRSPAASPAPGTDLFAVLHGLYWAVADRAAQGPLLLTVDDVHWCDLPSLRFLAYLARRLDGLPVALLVAGRPVVLDAARSEVLDAMAREPGVRVLRPAPLSRAGTRTLITAVLGTPDDDFEDACRGATGGNPFLLGELLADLHREGTEPRAAAVERVAAAVPREVERSVRARLAALGPDAVSLARAAAVLGDGVDARRAAELASVAPEVAGPVVDALVTSRILAPGRATTGLAFLHPLVRSAVQAGTGPSEWAEAHRRAVAVLTAAGVDDDGLVRHLLAARPSGDPAVVAALRAAAGRAAARGVPESAAQLLRRALDEPPTGPASSAVLLELGSAEMRAGDPAALDHLLAAADEAGTVDARAVATLALGRVLLHAGRGVEAVRRLLAVLEEVEAAEPGPPASERALELEAELVTVATQDPATRPVTEARLARRTRDPEPTTRGGCVLLAALAVEETVVQGSRTRAVALAEAALTGGHLLGEPVMARLPAVGITLALGGRPAAAVAMWDEAITALRRHGDMRGFALASAFRGYACTYTGDLVAALGDLRQAVELVERDPSQALTRSFAVAWLVEGLLDTGELDTAEELVAAHAVRSGGPMSAGSYLLRSRGRLRLAQGRPEEAARDLRECGGRLEAAGAGAGAVFRWRPGVALALRDQGDDDAARVVADEAVAAAEAWGAPLPLAEALRVAGEVAPRGEGIALLRRAVDVAAEAPLERARDLLALGRALHRAGDRGEARDVLRDALDAAVERGATAIARAAQDELVATGARPRRPRTSGAEALTPTERRVAGAVAEGATNRAVAQALFVSEKTVETHLGSVYRKLGIAARSQLADALGDAGATPRAAGTRR
ncbi:ATP-binding protein [Actinomycetospora lemnae]|uniref:AAA family ATPase n=1 Tax=Actinomycetospora lemnae TaxID=3019891 RepID=A0ABT5SWE9_9PSEU|nr:LuxR family transcriptional regulator [Actinomycetospora sp. DW7H6]MDD7967177.1 AAA family ATPase [Actinomycetospora sp. DW7H6]